MPTPPPTYPEAGRRTVRGSWLAVIAGVVVGALVAGIPLLLTRGDGGGGFGATHEALHAPANLDGFTSIGDNAKINGSAKKRAADADPISAKNLSDAYGGAATTVKQYVDADLLNFLTLEAVRATSPKP